MFALELLSSGDKDTFELDSKGGKVVIRGTDGIAVASGLNWYLKYYCNAHIGWHGDQLNLPDELPMVSKRERRVSLTHFSYYENVCTFSYSQAWWTWERWERELDWMALNGINLPLAITGQEYVLAKVFERLGLTKEEMDEYFTGPAFLAWNRMGNIKQFAGPLPQSFIEGQFELQKKILARARSFGMRPVLPSFAGFVPEAVVRKNPNTEFGRAQPWSGFQDESCCMSMLSPSEPLFQEIGKMFMEEVIKAYGGQDHLYACDTFNENRPSNNDLNYLKASSQAVYNAMKAVDPKAVWVMQGWLFVNDWQFWTPNKVDGTSAMKALLDGVPASNMIVLDLHADVHPIWQLSNNFHGRPFVWCALHNFGGQTGMYGRLKYMAEGALAAAASPGTRMQGVGITMEGIEQNQIVYELVLELRWHTKHFDVDKWVARFISRRYGLTPKTVESDVALASWALIADSVYSVAGQQMGATKSLIELRPRFNMASGYAPGTAFMPTTPGYNMAEFYRSWEGMVQIAPARKHVAPFVYDLVDVSKQVLADYFLMLFLSYQDAYTRAQPKEMETLSVAMLEVIDDMNQLLLTHPMFLLGRWVNDARALGTTKEEEELFEMNARNQVTQWGFHGEINDYASKTWAGLVDTYYKPRWQLFFKYTKGAVAIKKPFDEAGYFNAVYAFEQAWQKDKLHFATTPLGNTVTTVQHMFAKYNPVISKALPMGSSS